MVKKIIVDKIKTYQCEDCKLTYLNKKNAEKCEKWCRRYNACNLMITKHAINK